MFDRITFDPGIMGDRAGIRGMRIPVSAHLRGASWERINEAAHRLKSWVATQVGGL